MSVARLKVSTWGTHLNTQCFGVAEPAIEAFNDRAHFVRVALVVAHWRSINQFKAHDVAPRMIVTFEVQALLHLGFRI